MHRNLFSRVILPSCSCALLVAAAGRQQTTACTSSTATTTTTEGDRKHVLKGADAEKKSTYRTKEAITTDEDTHTLIRNGFVIDENATPSSLSTETRQKFALRVSHEKIIGRNNFPNDQILLSNSKDAATDAANNVGVFTTPPLLTRQECRDVIQLGESLGLEQGDFIYVTGKKQYERMATGGRRSSSTILVVDPAMTTKLTKALNHCQVLPKVLNDGRKFVGARNSFLISRYHPGQYFAPHYDGRMLCIDDDDDDGKRTVAMFTAVLYLTEDFTGGSTHYLPDDITVQGLAVQPPSGSAVVHRAVSIRHAGGEVLSGVKYVMQFFLMYEALPEDADEQTLDLKPLRWGI